MPGSKLPPHPPAVDPGYASFNGLLNSPLALGAGIPPSDLQNIHNNPISEQNEENEELPELPAINKRHIIDP